jgi:hypothetical protein
MRQKKCSFISGVSCFLFFFCFCFIVGSYAQDCRIVEKRSEDTYIIKIGDKELYAVPGETLAKALETKKELEIALKQIARLEGLVAEYEKYREQCKETIDRKEEVIKELKSIVDLYKGLTDNYSKLKTPLVTAEIGVGVTGDTEPAVMLGVGFRKFRVYGFFQKENVGAMVGLALPIF